MEPTITIPLSMLGDAKDLSAEEISKALRYKVEDNQIIGRQGTFISNMINGIRRVADQLDETLNGELKSEFSRAQDLRILSAKVHEYAKELRETYDTGQY